MYVSFTIKMLENTPSKLIMCCKETKKQRYFFLMFVCILTETLTR